MLIYSISISSPLPKWTPWRWHSWAELFILCLSCWRQFNSTFRRHNFFSTIYSFLFFFNSIYSSFIKEFDTKSLNMENLTNYSMFIALLIFFQGQIWSIFVDGICFLGDTLFLVVNLQTLEYNRMDYILPTSNTILLLLTCRIL